MSETNGFESWDAYIQGQIRDEHEAMIEIVGGAIAMAMDKLKKEMTEAIRVALLEAGVAPRVRGTYREAETYHSLDIVACDGTIFIAKISNPGPCPGSGWQLMSQKGEKGRMGPRGERGEKGDPGEDGRSINVASWIVNPRDFTVKPKMADGSFAPTIDLLPLFKAYDQQVRGEPQASAAAPPAEPPLLIEMVERADG